MPCSKREWLRRESSDRELSSMAPPWGQIELCSRHRRLEALPAYLWIRQNHRFRQVPPLSVRNFSVRPASRDNGGVFPGNASAGNFYYLFPTPHTSNMAPLPRLAALLLAC